MGKAGAALAVTSNPEKHRAWRSAGKQRKSSILTWGILLKINSNAVSAKGANTFKVKGFPNKQKLNNHWQNGRTHAAEYAPDGITTKEQYEKRAVQLLESPCGNGIKGYKTKDGLVCRYDAKKNDFAKGSPEKGVRTMFKPDDGEDYYKRQLELEGIEDD